MLQSLILGMRIGRCEWAFPLLAHAVIGNLVITPRNICRLAIAPNLHCIIMKPNTFACQTTRCGVCNSRRYKACV